MVCLRALLISIICELPFFSVFQALDCLFFMWLITYPFVHRNVGYNLLECFPRSSGYAFSTWTGVDFCVSSEFFGLMMPYLVLTKPHIIQPQCGKCSFSFNSGQLWRSKCDPSTCSGHLDLQWRRIVNIAKNTFTDLSNLASL
jgi:hypothetical protein